MKLFNELWKICSKFFVFIQSLGQNHVLKSINLLCNGNDNILITTISAEITSKKEKKH